MRQSATVASARFIWLVLTAMMLVSRVIFQRRGAVGMRRFLDRWKDSRAKLVWGTASVVTALAIAVSALIEGGLDRWDIVIVWLLVVILLADGLVNVLPGGFHTFKDTVQERWVRRHQGTPREGDRSMFGTINLGLAIAAAGWAAVVLTYRPMRVSLALVALMTAVVCTPTLIALAEREGSLEDVHE